jgi:hypothetical protein
MDHSRRLVLKLLGLTLVMVVVEYGLYVAYLIWLNLNA